MNTLSYRSSGAHRAPLIRDSPERSRTLRAAGGDGCRRDGGRAVAVATGLRRRRRRRRAADADVRNGRLRRPHVQPTGDRQRDGCDRAGAGASGFGPLSLHHQAVQHLPAADIDFEGRSSVGVPLDDENAADGCSPIRAGSAGRFGRPAARTRCRPTGAAATGDAAAAKLAKTVRRLLPVVGPDLRLRVRAAAAPTRPLGPWRTPVGCDGGAFIVGCPPRSPTNFFVRAFARCVLGPKHNNFRRVSPGQR